MKRPPDKSNYATLLADIGRLYEDAQKVLVEAYWQIGRRISPEYLVGALPVHRTEGL